MHVVLVAQTFGAAYDFGCMDFYRCTDFWLHAILTIEIKKHGINRAYKFFILERIENIFISR